MTLRPHMLRKAPRRQASIFYLPSDDFPVCKHFELVDTPYRGCRANVPRGRVTSQ